VAAACGKAL
jgi:Zinc knuckle